MVTFTIVEGSSNDFDYDGFSKDYVENILTKKEIMKKYDLNDSQYYRKSKQVQRDTGFHRKKGARTNTEERYIKKMGENQYHINKNINGFRVYCGSYPSFKVAKTVRNQLIENDWDMDLMMELRKKYGNFHKGKRAYNQHTGSLISKKALEKYDEFKRLYMSGKYQYIEILDMLDFTRHMYSVCLKELKLEYPTIRKKIVRRTT